MTCNNKTIITSKTLTVANQTEVPILHYLTTTINTTIEETSRQFIIPFALAYIKYNILGTPFFEEYIQNIKIQDFTIQFKYQSKNQPNTIILTSLFSKDYPYFSYIYRLKSKTQIRLNPNSSNFAHFPKRTTTIFTLVQPPKQILSYNTIYLLLSSKFRTTFNFIEVFTDGKPDICSKNIQNSTNHIATLPKGHIGYIEVPITNEQAKYYQNKDLNTLVHNVAHTYHPDITEPIPLSNYNTPTQDIPSLSNHFSFNQKDMTLPTLHDSPHSNIYNVQPTSDTPKSRTFPTLPHSKDNLKFINKFNFQFSDPTDTEY